MTSHLDNVPSAISQSGSPPPASSADDFCENVVKSLTIGLVAFDRQFNILLRNPAAEVLLPRAGHVAEALSRLTVDGTFLDWTTELRKIIRSSRPRRFDAKVPQEKDQPPAYLEIMISPLRSRERGGEPTGGLLLVEDVSARISMERRLAVSERLAAVGKLAARVAHELNNPLDGILRYTNLAIRRAGDSGDPKIAEYLESAKSGLVRMTGIIRALLEFSRSMPEAVEQATINKIVEDALSTMEERARQSATTIVCNFLQADMPVVRGSSIFQVCCNLIKNAFDAMPDGGTLTVTTDIIGPDVVIRFDDTGIGLPEDVDRIFEPFFTTKGPGKGTGLGLAVCKDLIERYGGSITAARRKPRGSSIAVNIPLRNCAAESRRASCGAASKPGPTAPSERKGEDRPPI